MRFNSVMVLCFSILQPFGVKYSSNSARAMKLCSRKNTLKMQNNLLPLLPAAFPFHSALTGVGVYEIRFRIGNCRGGEINFHHRNHPYHPGSGEWVACGFVAIGLIFMGHGFSFVLSERYHSIGRVSMRPRLGVNYRFWAYPQPHQWR